MATWKTVMIINGTKFSRILVKKVVLMEGG